MRIKMNVSYPIDLKFFKFRHAILLFGLFLCTVSGCAVTPIDFSTEDRPSRRFSGFTTQPGEPIRIQAATAWDAPWVTLKRTTTGETPLRGFAGVPYYYWNTTVEVPEEFWWETSFNPTRTVGEYYTWGVYIRVIDSAGRVLYNYRENVSATELQNENPIDLWNRKGNSRGHMVIWLQTRDPAPF